MIQSRKLNDWYREYKSERPVELVRIFSVDYAHFHFEDGADLYVTEGGLKFAGHFFPENFLEDKAWFKANALPLSGTSSLYKIRTKEFDGCYKDVVVKWNRMGKDIPGAHECDELVDAEFNSPFEEFSLVTELRGDMYHVPEGIMIQYPLAIYTPPQRDELWRTGRQEYKMRRKLKSHEEVALDICRSYAVIYEWMEGVDAVEACKRNLIDERLMGLLNKDSEERLGQLGYVVRDRKPHHIVVEPRPDGGLQRNIRGRVAYSLVDFELLDRTKEHNERVKKDKRVDYLKRQRDRFATPAQPEIDPRQHTVNLFGVDYVYGHAETTQGRLWVVGRDPLLFDYFLPERWEHTPKMKLSEYREIYHTVTKDNIHLVWDISQVGMKPDMDPFKEDERKILEYGYNSPFEAVAMAVELNRRGIPAIYPRAIYAPGNKSDIPAGLFAPSRYETHKDLKTPDGLPVLEKDRDYIVIWGYWNGPDEKLAAQDGDFYEGIDALRGYREGIIDRQTYESLLEIAKQKLLGVGVEDLNLRGNHFLISLDREQQLIKGEGGLPEIRICNFEFLRHT